MDNYPLISIIVPVYNVEPYIQACLDSLCNQTYQNIEIICMDDGSPDNSAALIEAIASRDPRVHLYHQKNGGVSSARNHAMKWVHGEYVTFIDSDDWVDSQYIECLWQTITEYDADIAVCSYKKHLGTREISFPYIHGNEGDTYLCDHSQAVKYFLEEHIAVWCKLYKTELVKSAVFPVGRQAEEYEFQLNVLECVTRIAFCNKRMYYYRMREDSISHGVKPKFVADNIQAIYGVLRICERSFPDEVAWSRAWLDALLYQFYSAEAFAESEKSERVPLFTEIVNYMGGREAIKNEMLHPLDTIFYTYEKFENILTHQEKKLLQKDFRETFHLVKGEPLARQIKNWCSYVSLKWAVNITKKCR